MVSACVAAVAVGTMGAVDAVRLTFPCCVKCSKKSTFSCEFHLGACFTTPPCGLPPCTAECAAAYPSSWSAAAVAAAAADAASRSFARVSCFSRINFCASTCPG